MKKVNVIDIATNHVVKVRKFSSISMIPVWADPHLCEDDHLYFIENLSKEKLIRVNTGDFFVKDEDKVYLVKKADAKKRLKFKESKC